MSVSWHSCDLRSGRRGVRVPTTQLGSVSRIIGQSTETTLDTMLLNRRGGPFREWAAATEQGRTMLVAVDDATDDVIWGGMVLRRGATEGPTATVVCATLEHYLDRRYVGDLTFTNTDQASIARGMIDGLAVDGLNFTVDLPTTGIMRDRTYLDIEDRTVLSALSDLMDVESGLEFTVDLAWTDDTHTVLGRTLVGRTRIGVSPTEPARMTYPGNVQSFSYDEDYSSDNGANDVTAIGQADDEEGTRFASRKVADDLISGGWARFERRFTPSTSIVTQAILDGHAAKELADVRDGMYSLKLTARDNAFPRLRSDWDLGDDLLAVITAPRFPARTDSNGTVLPGYEQVVRAVGWERDLDAGTVTPVTQEVR